MAVGRPDGLRIVVKGNPEQGTGNEVFGVWENGLIRQITGAEFQTWTLKVDYWIPKGDDAQFNQFKAYDKALRGQL